MFDAMLADGRITSDERGLVESDPKFAEAMCGTFMFQVAALGVALTDLGVDGKKAIEPIWMKVAHHRDEALRRFFCS